MKFVVHIGRHVIGRFAIVCNESSSECSSRTISTKALRFKLPHHLFRLFHSNRVVLIRLTSEPEAPIDYAGSYRLVHLLRLNLTVNRLMWELSSLGGAFSALGDSSLHFAEKAGLTASEQLRIALAVDDPILIARCYLYAALSLGQRGRVKAAANIVRAQHAIGKKLKSDFLKCCCEGVWFKLKTFRGRRHEEQPRTLCNGRIS